MPKNGMRGFAGLLGIALGASSAFAAPTKMSAPTRSRTQEVRAGDPELFVEFGSQFANLLKVTRSPTASRSLLGTHQFYLSLAGKLGRFRPEIGLNPIARNGKGDTHRSRHWGIQVPFVVASTNRTEWKVGAALWMHTVSGSGGDITLTDGTGTSTFSKPGRSSTSRTLAFVGGLTTPIGYHPRLFLDADLNLLSPLSTRRSAHLLIQLGWKFL